VQKIINLLQPSPTVIDLKKIEKKTPMKTVNELNPKTDSSAYRRHFMDCEPKKARFLG
jgi:hypothetical protein